MSAYRTAQGGRVDRSRKLRFRFDDAGYEGLAGDTLASALLANGVHLVGRSFKYHRPRGIVTAGAGEPNALVTVRRDAGRTTPNLRATQVELYDGLEAESQNRWPSLSTDWGALASLAAPLLPAALERAAASPYVRVVVQPHLLFGGRLLDRVGEQVGQAAANCPAKQWQVTPHLGCHPSVVEAIADRLEGR